MWSTVSTENIPYRLSLHFLTFSVLYAFTCMLMIIEDIGIGIPTPIPELVYISQYIGYNKPISRVHEIRRTRRTCPANLENVRRGVLTAPDIASGESKSRTLKCPAKCLVFTAHFTVKSLARIQNVQRRACGSQDKMSGEAHTNFAYPAISVIPVSVKSHRYANPKLYTYTR